MSIRKLRPLVLSATLALSTQSFAATFNDSFSSGLNATYWNVTQTTPGLYTVNANAGQVSLARSVHAPTAGPQNVFVNLNLAALGGNIAGDFSTQIDFNHAVLGANLWDQVEFHANFANGSFFFDVHDNSNSIVNNHVWYDVTVPYTGGIGGGFHNDPSNSGTFKIDRVGSLVSGRFNNTLLFSVNNTSALSGISFMLQNNLTNDMISANFDNFNLTAASVPAPVPEPETYAMMLAGLGLLGVAARRRKFRTG